jgi:hypothetical protein
VHILTAFEQMLGGLFGGDAPGWQIDQIIFWEEKVSWAVTCADLADADAGTLGVPDGEGSGLPVWHLSCLSFLQSLQRQEREADRMQADETAAAAAAGHSAAAALSAGGDQAEASAAWYLAEAGRHREAARRNEDWLTAARDARIYGTGRLPGALPRHPDAAAGRAAAGGAGEVYRDTSRAGTARPASRGATV